MKRTEEQFRACVLREFVLETNKNGLPRAVSDRSLAAHKGVQEEEEVVIGNSSYLSPGPEQNDQESTDR